MQKSSFSYFLFVSIAILMVFSMAVHAQSNEWKHFYSSLNPAASVFRGTDLWIGGKGLMKLEIASGNTTLYDIANSGLPGMRVSALAVDSSNDLWVGTDKGLARYDGTQWTIFTSANSSLPSDTIRSLMAGTSGDLWIGTVNGLSRLNGSSWTLFNSANAGFSSNIISALTLDAGSKTVFAWDGKGIMRFNGNSWTSFGGNTSATLTASICADGPTTVWSVIAGTHMDTVVTEFGIVIVPVNGVMLMKHQNGSVTLKKWLTGTVMTAAVAVDSSHNVWIGTDRILSVYDGSSFVTYTPANSGLPSSCVSTIALDGGGNPWIGTLDWFDNATGIFFPEGITSFLLGTWKTHSTSRNTLASDVVNDMLIDKSNSVWFSSGITVGPNGRARRGGLTRFNGTTWTSWNSSSSNLPHDVVADISLDPSGSLTVLSFPVSGSLNASISRFTGSQWTQLPNSINGRSAIFLTTATDNTGSVWAGSYLENSLWKFNGAQWIEYTPVDVGSNYNAVNSVYYDSGNRLWAATISCILRYDGTEWKRYDTTSTGLTFFNANSISEDVVGNIWVSATSTFMNGTFYGNAIAAYSGSAWTSYAVPNLEISGSDKISAVTADNHGNIWVGTKGYGLKRLTGGIWKELTTGNSHLLSNTITALSVDKNDNLWIATNAGVSLYQEGGIVMTASRTASEPPAVFALQQNFPNPFNPSTMITYSVKDRGRVRLVVYDLLGRHIATLVDHIQSEGSYQQEFLAVGLTSGIYYYALSSGGSTAVRKMLLIK